MKRLRIKKRFFVVLLVVVFACGLGINLLLPEEEIAEPAVTKEPPKDAKGMIALFAEENNLELSDWPEELVTLLDENPDTKEFVLNYPIKKNKDFEINLEEYIHSQSVPLLYQWDERWGYKEYNESIMGLSGCGPTCVSMVSLYILKDKTMTPLKIAKFSEENGYCLPDNGSLWTLISEGTKRLGLKVRELGLDENLIKSNLEKNNPIICNMGPGDFSKYGHYIVLSDYIDGKIKINDPNSKIRSEKLWTFSEIKDQIRNLWAFTD